MKNTTILCLKGPKDSGKTTTIKKTADLLKQTYPEAEVQKLEGATPGDLFEYYLVNGKKISFCSDGDINATVREHLNVLILVESCDIVITATRTKRIYEKDAVEEFEEKGYTVIWIDKQRTDDHEGQNSAMAEEILQNIEELITEEQKLS